MTRWLARLIGRKTEGLRRQVRQFVCGLHGHDTLVLFEPDRMCLRCVSCGHESRGWCLADPTPRVVKQPPLLSRKERLIA